MHGHMPYSSPLIWLSGNDLARRFRREPPCPGCSHLLHPHLGEQTQPVHPSDYVVHHAYPVGASSCWYKLPCRTDHFQQLKSDWALHRHLRIQKYLLPSWNVKRRGLGKPLSTNKVCLSSLLPNCKLRNLILEFWSWIFTVISPKCLRQMDASNRKGRCQDQEMKMRWVY